MTPNKLLFLLKLAEQGKEWAIDYINDHTEYEDFKSLY
jgi:hypothetical protein